MTPKAADAPRDAALERGREVRARVVGKANHRSDVDREFLDLITRYAFGDVWSRPGLDFDTRRLLTLAMTIAGGHYEEFKLHLKFALANGVERATVKEVMLQSAIYCGVPAALGAFRAADQVYRELDVGPS
jgi:alkylhydroperoxidase/carboxymuconolactone decarboxylase family protein YurZ